MTDTIFALSSGKLPSGVAVVRMSGVQCRFGFETICGFCPEPRQMKLASLRNYDGQLLDRGLVVFFEGPSSFTGEDCGEFHIHGGTAVVRAVLGRLGALVGFRAAEAGEFTKRAFLAGKLDLTAAEGLADLISAETEAQRRLALSQAEGSLNALYTQWRRELIRIRSMLEAAIEFSEEDDVALRATITVRDDIARLMSAVQSHIEGARSAEIIRDGYQVVILGAPNAGKSSLLNTLAGREVAIASDEAGTTRDIIEVRLELNGQLIIISDTAGIRVHAGKVEALGIAKALDRSASADLVILVYDASNPVEFEFSRVGAKILRIGTHQDRLITGTEDVDGFDLVVSSKTGFGFDRLQSILSDCASADIGSSLLAPVRDRQVSLLSQTLINLGDALGVVDHRPDLTAEHLRMSSEYLGRLVGEVDVEDLLDVIFSTFCIGK